MVDVRFSSALESITDERTTTVDAKTVNEAIDILAESYGEEFQDGELRRFVNLYVNGEDVRHHDGLETKLDDDDEISILPAVSGGSGC
ncbi:MAG: ubiquitin-like small modifier protein 1 [Halobacteria archaeon]|nr:ubiquitin-like small modifier protein 1 [Halobacteria archaeon]